MYILRSCWDPLFHFPILCSFTITIQVWCLDPVFQIFGLGTMTLSYLSICLFIKSQEIKQKQSAVCLQVQPSPGRGPLSVLSIRRTRVLWNEEFQGIWEFLSVDKGGDRARTCWACVDKYLQTLFILCFKYPAHGVLKPA